MNDSLLTRIWIFYRDGFREMTLGRTLWTIILIKLFITSFPPSLAGRQRKRSNSM